MTYGFYSMPIGIENESGEIVGVVLTVESGRSVILAALGNSGRVESEHRVSARRTETDVHTRG
jgi:hypothetical protein